MTKHWQWCDHLQIALRDPKGRPATFCAGCHLSVTATPGPLVHYLGGHYHVECVLDLLPAPPERDVYAFPFSQTPYGLPP
jgi:hypothetical protein